MKSKQHTLTRDEIGFLTAFLALLLGGWARIYTVLQTDFPINDGGLFYKMVEAIQNNHFLLPEYVSYNGLSIPFAYPPLAFYVAAILGQVTQAPLIDVFRLFPAVILVGTIAAFYPLAKAIFDDRLSAGVATLVFALIPRSLTWYVMGGGLTRSPGFLFLILAIRYVYTAFSKGSRRDIALAILFCSLVVLTHPEAAIHTAGISLLFWLFKGRSKKGMITALIIAGGTILFSSIWWIPLLLRFGIHPITAAGGTGLQGWSSVIYPFIQYDEEPGIAFIMVLAFIGISIKLAQRNYLLPALYFVPFFVELRDGVNVVMISLALLASSAITELIIPGLNQFEENHFRGRGNGRPIKKYAAMGTAIFLTIYVLIAIFFQGGQLANQKVSQANRQAFQWIRENTPTSSRFLIITGKIDLFRDWTQEWFPVLTGRISQTTIQGREWLDGSQFIRLIKIYQDIQSCPYSEAPANCIAIRAGEANIPFDYLYLAKLTGDQSLPGEPQGIGLLIDLQHNKDFSLVYDSKSVTIFQYKPQE